jgi:hypothetical protein
MLGQNAIDLKPSFGCDGDPFYCSDLGARASIVNVDAEHVGSGIRFARIDQRQVAASLGVLLQAADPGTAGRSRSKRYGIVEETIFSTAARSRGPCSNDDASLGSKFERLARLSCLALC